LFFTFFNIGNLTFFFFFFCFFVFFCFFLIIIYCLVQSPPSSTGETKTASSTLRVLKEGEAEYNNVKTRVENSSLPFEGSTTIHVTRVTRVTRVGDALENSELQFHGTPEVDAILRSGFRLPTMQDASGALGGPALYFSRSAKTAFWHSQPQFVVEQGTSHPQRHAVGQLLLCSVQVGRSKELEAHAPNLTAEQLHSNGYDSATICAAKLWPSSMIDDETAIYEAHRAKPIYLVQVIVRFQEDERTLQLVRQILSAKFKVAVTTESSLTKFAEMRRRLCNPEVKRGCFEDVNEAHALVIFESLKARACMMELIAFSCGFVHGGGSQLRPRSILSAAGALRCNVQLLRLQITLFTKNNSAKNNSAQCDMEWAMAQLCRGLETNTCLVELVLAGFVPTSKDGAGTLAICRMIAVNHTLRVLHLTDIQDIYNFNNNSKHDTNPECVAMINETIARHRSNLKIVYQSQGLGYVCGIASSCIEPCDFFDGENRENRGDGSRIGDYGLPLDGGLELNLRSHSAIMAAYYG
jgi:hypothetical protein